MRPDNSKVQLPGRDSVPDRGTPRWSVVVPTCARPELLAACLERLAPARQTLAAERYEVLVSDDGEATAQEMMRRRFPWARWVAGPRRGPAANRNHGAREAGGEWVVFLDDDCLADAGWLAAYAAGAEAQPALAVLEGCTLASGARNSIDMEAPVNTSGGFLWSCNFAMRRRRFLELGGFDTGFPGPAMEDVEFRTRLRVHGVESFFVAGALVHHPWRKRKGTRFLHVYARSVDHFLALHPRQAGFFTVRFLARIMVGQLWRNARDAFRECGGRGVFRVTGLEIYTFLLLARRAWRR